MVKIKVQKDRERTGKVKVPMAYEGDCAGNDCRTSKGCDGECLLPMENDAGAPVETELQKKLTRCEKLLGINKEGKRIL